MVETLSWDYKKHAFIDTVDFFLEVKTTNDGKLVEEGESKWKKSKHNSN